MPFGSLFVVLRNTPAIFISQVKFKLGKRIAVFGSLAIPLERFSIVPLDTPAILVHHTKRKLCLGIAVFGGFSV